MNIVDGRVLNKKESILELENLEDRILKTLRYKPLDTDIVIDACDKLSRKLTKEDYLKIIGFFEVEEFKINYYFKLIKLLLSREYLEEKINRELGHRKINSYRRIKPLQYKEVKEKICPLGVLLHLGSGNADGLPVFSLIEGLLMGNINILKTSSKIDNHISLLILMELIKIEEKLKEYIYVFDYSSREIELMEKLAYLADGIAIWGGSDAVKSIRKLAKTNINIIEWGHKVSFIYIDLESLVEKDLYDIAEEICFTNQLYCSSPQGIYLDTEDINKLYDFSEKFIKILDKVSYKMKNKQDINLDAEISLEIQTEKIKSLDTDNRIYKGEHSNIIVYDNPNLENSMMFRNPWVKAMKKENILRNLKKYKNYLQTVGLVCSDENKEEIAELFFKSGAVRVCKVKNMSKSYSGMAHDGDYPLLRYSKKVILE